MSIFKCKMCGGDLEVAEGNNIAECEYCGTKQTVPSADNEKKVNLFNRANRLRIGGEFDKAASIYESIVAEFPEEAEAYWGLCLCRYGIEYVDDPATAKKIPTCHRASFESLQKDENFNLALEYADVIAQKVYRDEAREIDRIMSEILAVSKTEKPYDVFICYKETDEKGERTIDSVLAQDIYEALTAKGLKVFFARITLEDKLGQQYEPYIFAALNSAKVMLAIGTKYEYFHAVWVKNEWSRFLKLMAKDKSKTLIPCFKDLDAYDMPEEFKGLQAQDLGKIGAMQDLVRGVEKLVGHQPEHHTVVTQVAAGPNIETLLQRGNMAIEDENWDEAKIHFNKILDINAECAEAYFGLALVETKRKSVKELVENEAAGNKNYQRAKQFASGVFLESLNQAERDFAEYKREQLNHIDTLKTLRKRNKPFSKLISAGGALLFSNGQVKATGDNENGQCNVNKWNDIVAVSSSSLHTVGLKNNGTVVAVGYNEFGQCKVSSWKEIVDVSAVGWRTVGLKKDGTVLEVGSSPDAEFSLEHRHEAGKLRNWKNIISISAGDNHTVGLKADGTVIAVGNNYFGQCKIANWRYIVDISASAYHTVGLKFDGTVIATGDNKKGQCNVTTWKDIIAVSAGDYHTVGLKADGTVVAVGDNYNGGCNVKNWRDIIAVSAGSWYTMGLKKDGTVVTTGCNSFSGIRLFDSYDDFINERTEKIKQLKEKKLAEQKAEQLRLEQERIAEQKRLDKMKQYRAKGLCQYCGGTFKGLFTKKCVNCGKEKDY